MLKIHQDVWSQVAKVKVSERNQERKKGTLWDLSRLANKYFIKYFSISREWMVRELIFPSALAPPRKILAPLSSKTASKSSLWVRSVVEGSWYRQWGAWTRPSMGTFGPHLCEVNWSPWKCQPLDMVPQHVQKASKKIPWNLLQTVPNEVISSQVMLSSIPGAEEQRSCYLSWWSQEIKCNNLMTTSLWTHPWDDIANTKPNSQPTSVGNKLLLSTFYLSKSGHRNRWTLTGECLYFNCDMKCKTQSSRCQWYNCNLTAHFKIKPQSILISRHFFSVMRATLWCD